MSCQLDDTLLYTWPAYKHLQSTSIRTHAYVLHKNYISVCTCKKHNFACQSAVTGISPLSCSSGTSSFRRLLWVPLALSQVSWSPTNKDFRYVWQTTFAVVCWNDGTNCCKWAMISAICHVLFSLRLITPNEICMQV